MSTYQCCPSCVAGSICEKPLMSFAHDPHCDVTLMAQLTADLVRERDYSKELLEHKSALLREVERLTIQVDIVEHSDKESLAMFRRARDARDALAQECEKARAVCEAALAWARDENIDDFEEVARRPFTPAEKRLIATVMRSIGLTCPASFDRPASEPTP